MDTIASYHMSRVNPPHRIQCEVFIGLKDGLRLLLHICYIQHTFPLCLRYTR
jgi:hypothetical protein